MSKKEKPTKSAFPYTFFLKTCIRLKTKMVERMSWTICVHNSFTSDLIITILFILMYYLYFKRMEITSPSESDEQL